MRLREIKRLVESTSDSAFAVDSDGRIVVWNQPCEKFFGLSSTEAVGKTCSSVIQGMDECGEVCSRDCTIRQSVKHRYPVGNYDLQVNTPQGKKWCNISVLIADNVDASLPYSIHIVRETDVRKKLEILVRDFIVQETHLPAEQAFQLISTIRSPSKEANLTTREIEVLRLLAKGESTAKVANQLHVSRTTINNHIQHILRKLDAHSRLEAIRRAERAGLI
jgi:PAS domain S-box-containing protein